LSQASILTSYQASASFLISANSFFVGFLNFFLSAILSLSLQPEINKPVNYLVVALAFFGRAHQALLPLASPVLGEKQ